MSAARQVMQLSREILQGVRTIPELKVLGEPAMSVICFAASKPSLNIFNVGDAMTNRGWSLSVMQNPVRGPPAGLTCAQTKYIHSRCLQTGHGPISSCKASSLAARLSPLTLFSSPCTLLLAPFFPYPVPSLFLHHPQASIHICVTYIHTRDGAAVKFVSDLRCLTLFFVNAHSWSTVIIIHAALRGNVYAVKSQWRVEGGIEALYHLP